MSRNFWIYLIGYVFAGAGAVYALSAIGLGVKWITSAVLIMLGVGIVSALARSKKSDLTDARAEHLDP